MKLSKWAYLLAKKSGAEALQILPKPTKLHIVDRQTGSHQVSDSYCMTNWHMDPKSKCHASYILALNLHRNPRYVHWVANSMCSTVSRSKTQHKFG